MKPLLSIIIPSYNHEQFLEERFRSIFSQKCTDYELIVLDDASRDGSQARIKKILHGKPHCFVPSKVNSGSPFKQWERGLQLAKGKYIWIAESDDCCNAEFLTSLLVPLVTNGMPFAFSRVRVIDEFGNQLQYAYWPELLSPHFFGESRVVPCRYFLNTFMRSRNCIPNASATLFQADGVKDKILLILQNINKLKYSGDWIFWARLLELYGNQQMLYLAQPLSSHRIHAATTRAFSGKTNEKARISEVSSTINRLNPLWPLSSLFRTIQVLFSGSWEWSYIEFLQRYRPSLIEKLTGSPQVGVHRIGFILYALRLLYSRVRLTNS